MTRAELIDLPHATRVRWNGPEPCEGTVHNEFDLFRKALPTNKTHGRFCLILIRWDDGTTTNSVYFGDLSDEAQELITVA